MISIAFFCLWIVFSSNKPVRFWNWNWYSVVPTEFLTVTFPVCSSSDDNSSGMINLVVYTFPSYNQELFYNPNLRIEEFWLHTFVKLPHLYRVPLILVILGSLDILAPLITWSSTLRGLPSRSCKYQRISWGSGLAWNWIATVNSDPTSPPSNPVFLASFWDGLAKSIDR